MFGYKLISKKEYEAMYLQMLTLLHDAETATENEKRVKADIASLRRQNIGLRMERSRLLTFNNEMLEALANIDLKGFTLTLCKSKCDHCNKETKDCCKYTFGKLDFCLMPKE